MAPKCGEKIENCNMEKKLKTKEGNLCSEICFFLQPVNLKELKIFRLRSARKKLKTKKFTFFFASPGKLVHRSGCTHKYT